MKIETEDYKLFKKRLLELGIEKIDFLEPDFLRSFEIGDVSIFNENQLETFLEIIEEKGIKLGNCKIYCITLDNLEEQINKIKLLQEKLQRSRILIGGNLSDKVIIERITVYENGTEDSELGSRLYEPYVSIEELTYICQTMQKDDFEKNEVLQIKTKFYAGTGEEERTFERGILLIDNITQLSKEDALRIKESGKIKYVSVKNSNGPDKYDVSTYIRILEAFQEITGDIDKSLSDEKKFEIVYRRICESIQYEDVIEDPETEDERKYKETCKSLEGGLLSKRSVCRGYSVILRNALISCGIDCECIEGYSEGEGHAWNKVKINGEWFNVDATWDRPDIVAGMQPSHALKSDEYIRKHDKKEGFGGPVCLRNATQEEIDKIFTLDKYRKDEMVSYYEMYPQYAKTALGREIIQLMIESVENDAEILNWNENILEHGTSIDFIKNEILRVHPTWQEYRKTETGLAVMRLLEAGATENDILRLDENYYFDENGIDIETIKNEIRKRMQAISSEHSKSTQELGRETLEEQKDTILLDEIEQEQISQERTINDQKEIK